MGCSKCGKNLVYSKNMCEPCYVKTKKIGLTIFGERGLLTLPEGMSPDEGKAWAQEEKNRILKEAFR